MLLALDQDARLQALLQSLSKFQSPPSDPQKGKELSRLLGNLYYHDLYQDKGFYAEAREVSEKLCSADREAHQAVRRSWVRALNALDPQNDLDDVVSRLYWSRKSRWERLAKQLKMPLPTHFRVYRAVRGTPFVEAVSKAWEDETRPLMSVWQESLASWSLSEEAARAFWGSGFDASDGVLLVAEVPFSQTFMDLLLDGGPLVLNHFEQHLIYVGSHKANDVFAVKEKTLVRHQGLEYTYEQRRLLSNLLKAGI